jgi:type I restriction enzyme S subunit
MAGDWAVASLAELTSTPPTYGVVQPGQDTAIGSPMLRVNNFQEHSLDLSEVMRIAPEVEAKYRRTRIQAGDVLLTIVGSVGQVAVVPDELSGWNIARAIAMIRPNKPDLSRWISLVLRSPQAQYQLGVTANTTVQTTINLIDLRELRIPMPDDDERKAIAHILGTLDDKIELNRRRNQTLEAMARALFKDWFIDFGPVRAKMNLPSSPGRGAGGEGGLQSKPYLPADLWQLFPDRLDDEGKPEGWEKKRISEYLSLAYGKSLPAGNRHQGGVPVYGSGGITGFHSEALVNGPVAIVGRKGTVGSLYWEDRPCFPIDTVFYVQPTAPLPFCYYLLESLPLRDMNTDAAVPGLNRENVYRLEVAAPPAELIAAFAESASLLRHSIAAISRDSETLAQLRDTLLPKLISGELRIADAVRFLETRP